MEKFLKSLLIESEKLSFPFIDKNLFLLFNKNYRSNNLRSFKLTKDCTWWLLNIDETDDPLGNLMEK